MMGVSKKGRERKKFKKIKNAVTKKIMKMKIESGEKYDIGMDDLRK